MGLRRPPIWVAPVLALLGGAVVAGRLDASGGQSDVELFANAGSTLLSGNWLHTYAAAEVQAGPLELALASAARTIGGGGQVGLAIVLDLVCTAAITAVAVLLLGRRPAALALFGIGALALWLPGAGYLGHPAELLIAVLWLLAAREARRGRPTVAGVLVGVSACFELWGVLGVAMLALAPSLRRCSAGVAAAAAVPLAVLLPFVLGGDFHMLDYAWVVSNGLPKLLLGAGHTFTWPDRLVEGAVIVAAGAGCARVVRRHPDSVWLVPAVTALARLPLDPVSYGYYWNTALVIMLIGATQLIGRRRELARRHFSRVAPAAGG
jgi:hypothetical protein